MSKTISQPEAESEDEDKEEEIVHYEDALEELENVLKHEQKRTRKTRRWQRDEIRLPV